METISPVYKIEDLIYNILQNEKNIVGLEKKTISGYRKPSHYDY